jgi:hypothetical protein
MGQRIEIESSQVVDESVIVTTNRSLTGADGEGYDSTEQADDVGTFGAKLAIDLFESDGDVERVFVTSNMVIIRRTDGWTDAATDTATGVIAEFFLYY